MDDVTADTTRNRAYLPRLDGLRGIAIMLVLAQHFYPSDYHFGENGVTLFFVISGFLITGILLDYSGELSIKDAAREFYLRRALRIVPVYYLCIGLAVLLNLGGIRHTWLLDGLWLANFRLAQAQDWGHIPHFWTLAVEEQFYLLWFPILMWAPRRLLAPIMASLVLLGPVWRWSVWNYSSNLWYGRVLLPAVVDSLASGALLAYASRFWRDTPGWKRFERTRMVLLLVLFCIVMYDDFFAVHSLIIMNLFCVCLVSAAADVVHDWRVDWLGGKALRHIGRISYSLYVFHLFVPLVVDPHTNYNWWASAGLSGLSRYIVLSCISIAIAELSWQCVEKPISRLKNRISFRRKVTADSPVTQFDRIAAPEATGS